MREVQDRDSIGRWILARSSLWRMRINDLPSSSSQMGSALAFGNQSTLATWVLAQISANYQSLKAHEKSSRWMDEENGGANAITVNLALKAWVASFLYLTAKRNKKTVNHQNYNNKTLVDITSISDIFLEFVYPQRNSLGDILNKHKQKLCIIKASSCLSIHQACDCLQNVLKAEFRKRGSILITFGREANQEGFVLFLCKNC